MVSCPVRAEVLARGVGGHCEHCDQHVYDLSAMTERQARSFLHRHRDRSVCVAYRTAPGGTVEFRGHDLLPLRGGLPLLLLLATIGGGCASLGATFEPPDDACSQGRGHRADCDDIVFPGYAWIPDAVEVEPEDVQEASRPWLQDGELEVGIEGGVEGGLEGAVVGQMVSGDFASPEDEPATSAGPEDEPATSTGAEVRPSSGIVLGGFMTSEPVPRNRQRRRRLREERRM
mgnify:FL=1